MFVDDDDMMIKQTFRMYAWCICWHIDQAWHVDKASVGLTNMALGHCAIAEPLDNIGIVVFWAKCSQQIHCEPSALVPELLYRSLYRCFRWCRCSKIVVPSIWNQVQSKFPVKRGTEWRGTDTGGTVRVALCRINPKFKAPSRLTPTVCHVRELLLNVLC